MATIGTSSASGSPVRHWLRVLRPLGWWLLLVLGLYGCRKHQEWLARTQLSFTVSMAGQPLLYEATAKLDGAPFLSGEPISLGRHRLTVLHPKGEPFETNLFIWYGEHNLGTIALNRATGTLVVQANPPAQRLSITGPEWRTNLANSPGLTISIPTDHYRVEAHYQRWDDAREVTVSAGATETWRVAPPLGALHVTCNREGASYQVLLSDGGSLVETGTLPALITGLPQGSYHLMVNHHGNRQERTVTVRTGTTNDAPIEFVYGTARLESEPSGAAVTSSDGQAWGVTPLTLTELRPGLWQFTFERQGYEPATHSLDIAANQTNQARASLVSRSYTAAMNAARQYLAAQEFERALAAADDALRAQPDDPRALALRDETKGRLSLARARALGQQGNYTAAAKELESLLELQPDNAEAKQLAREYARRQQTLAEEAERKRQADQAEQQRQKRLNRPKDYFEQWMKTVPNSALFDQFALTAKGSLAEVESRLVQALTNKAPVFSITAREHPETDLFSIRAVQDLGTGGWRRCDLVGGQTKDGEVLLVFKVFEYAYKEEFSIRAWTKDNDEKNMVPIHASRLDPAKTYLLRRRSEGVELVRGRITTAVGE